MWQVTITFLLRLAQQMIHPAAGQGAGVLSGVWMGLYQQPTAPITRNSTLANITEANYDGYSRQLVSWFPPFVSLAGPELLVAQDLFFSPTDSLLSNMITGVFLADAFYGGSLLMAAVVPGAGIVLGQPSNAVKVQAQFALSFAQGYGAPALVY